MVIIFSTNVQRCTDHRLKWQNGLQYARMKDDAEDGGEYDGWGLISGLRVYW